MYESDSLNRQKGFSLVELMVALVFTSILTAGMLRVFAATVSNFHGMHETVGIQRSARWAMSLIQEDILQAGYLFPSRVVSKLQATSSSQAPLLFQQTEYAPILTKPDGTTQTLDKVDEIQFVMDQAMGVEGKLKTALVAGTSTMEVTINAGGSKLKPGDVVLFQGATGGRITMVSIATVAGTPPDYTLTLDASNSGYTPTLDATGTEKFGEGTIIAGRIKDNLSIGMPVTFIRPEQVVRYTIAPRALDPADPAVFFPCLVRQEAPLVPGTILADADPANPITKPVGSSEQILAENVTGLKVDISLDGGQTFLRAGLGDKWDADIYNALNTAVASLTGSVTSTAKSANTTDLFWFNYVPVLLRLDIETRSRVARSEHSATGTTAEFKVRRETLLVSPRNFALGTPD